MRLKRNDPRDYQIMVLTTMLLYGVLWLQFDRPLAWIAGILGTAFATQWIATRVWRLPKFQWKSAAISGLSLCILMRCPEYSLSFALAGAAVLSKFVFRWRGKHVFNPTNFALAIGIVGTNVVTIDPGQWNNGIILALVVFCMGTFVSNRSCRSDVSYAFLATYAVGLVGAGFFLGTPIDATFAKLQTASLLIFCFFMISDPRSTPDSQRARIVFAALTAVIGLGLQLGLGYQPGLIVALAGLSLVTPLLDTWAPGERFEWQPVPVRADYRR